MLIAALIAGLACSAEARTDIARVFATQPGEIRYHKAPKPLTLRSDRIAVRSAHDVQGEPETVPGWHIVNAASSVRGDFYSPVYVDDLGGDTFATSAILVGVDAALTSQEALAIVHRIAPLATVIRQYEFIPGVFLMESGGRDGAEVMTLANLLADQPDVQFAEPDMVFSGRGALIPNDPNFPSCWGLRNTGQSGGLVGFDMNAVRAWDVQLGSASVLTLIIDTGVEQTHPDINQITGRDFTGTPALNGGPGNACDNHGTAVAGCVSERINNAIGATGVAPGTRSVSARCFVSLTNCSGGWNATYSWTADALNWAQSIGVRVTNNSNIYGGTSAAMDSAYAATRTAGMIHFAAAGNSGAGNIAYPSSLATVNAVAALDRTGVRSSFSQFGPGLDFSAPGREITTTDRTGAAGYGNGDYASVNGTSFASPYAAGVAALVFSHYPGLTGAQVQTAMQKSARDMGAVGYDTGHGWGMVQAFGALDAACPADFNLDGAIDFFDYLDFVAAFSSGAGTADFNADTAIDFFDYLDFVAAFSSGCNP
ncbi:MAG: S8 family serine peptidase [Planctomycetes bacterium]|nr:S8 family serine peptidase [Planctomycetota bacterium]